MDELENGECMMISYQALCMATRLKRHNSVAAVVGRNEVCERRYNQSRVRSGNNNFIEIILLQRFFWLGCMMNFYLYIGCQTIIADDLEEQITSLGEGI